MYVIIHQNNLNGRCNMRDVIDCKFCGGNAESTDGGETYHCDCGCSLINNNWIKPDDYEEDVE